MRPPRGIGVVPVVGREAGALTGALPAMVALVGAGALGFVGATLTLLVAAFVGTTAGGTGAGARVVETAGTGTGGTGTGT